MRGLFAICYGKSDHILAASQPMVGRRPDHLGHHPMCMSSIWYASPSAICHDGRHWLISRSTKSLAIGTAKILPKLTRAIRCDPGYNGAYVKRRIRPVMPVAWWAEA